MIKQRTFKISLTNLRRISFAIWDLSVRHKELKVVNYQEIDVYHQHLNFVHMYLHSIVDIVD